MINDLINTNYYILTCIEHIRAHVVNRIPGNANKIVQVIQRQREKRKFVLTGGCCGGKGRAPIYVNREERERERERKRERERERREYIRKGGNIKH